MPGHILKHFGSRYGKSILGSVGPLMIPGRVQSSAPSNLISYKIIGEASGTTVVDEVSTTLNGTHVGVTVGQPGIGGHTSGLYDGINDATNIYSVALNSVFNGSEGTAAIWAKVTNAAVWTDAQYRYLFQLYVSLTTRLVIYKSTANNTITALYLAGGISSSCTGLVSSTGWNMFTLTWSHTANEVKLYLNDAQLGSTAGALGNWIGSLDPASNCVGNFDVASVLAPWSGWLSHFALWKTPLSLGQVQGIYRGGI